jgi:hypothetical protein
MELKSIKSIPNQYPEDRDITQSYISDGAGISYYGKFQENKVDFEKIGLNDKLSSDIEIAEGTDFQFIVQFKDGTKFTSPRFHDKLKNIENETNPYVNKNSLPIILFDDSVLEDYSIVDKFRIGEAYAEVNVTDTLNTKMDYLKHIDYLTTSDSGNSPIKQATDMGSWELELTEDLGLRFQGELDALESVEEDFTANQPSTEIENPPPPTTSSQSVAHITIKPPIKPPTIGDIDNPNG